MQQQQQSIWDVVNNALLPGERVTHGMVLFGYDTDKVFNHIFSIYTNKTGDCLSVHLWTAKPQGLTG